VTCDLWRRYEEESICGDEDYQELQEARGVGRVGVCGAGDGVGAASGAALGRVVGYDFTVDEGWRIARVQVKSTMFREGTGYSCTLKDSRGPYKKNSFDFVAAYVIPEDVWYILPEKKIRGMWSVGLYPQLETAKYREYQEAWHLLRGETPGFVDRIEACAEEGFVEETLTS
jgi:hypothetical protein